MNQKIVTCFLVIVDDEINQNPEHNEYIKWWVEGQCLQNKYILVGQWSLLSHYLWSCKFANLKPWGKIWQSKINNTELKAMFWQSCSTKSVESSRNHNGGPGKKKPVSKKTKIERLKIILRDFWYSVSNEDEAIIQSMWKTKNDLLVAI